MEFSSSCFPLFIAKLSEAICTLTYRNLGWRNVPWEAVSEAKHKARDLTVVNITEFNMHYASLRYRSPRLLTNLGGGIAEKRPPSDLVTVTGEVPP